MKTANDILLLQNLKALKLSTMADAFPPIDDRLERVTRDTMSFCWP